MPPDTSPPRFSADLLCLNPAQETARITAAIRDLVVHQLKRRGLVVGLSGGIDSSVTAALAVAALGKARVLGLLMPERDSSPDTLRLSRLIAGHLGVPTVEEDLTPMLEAAGCYRRRDEAIRQVLPEFTAACQCKLVLPPVTDEDGYRLFSIVAHTPDGRELKARLPLEAYLGIVAASNFKQRTRKMLEYYHADRLHYAVAGTPNRLEYDQGFFVKLGDGAADLKPIAHLYKTQVYQLAEHLGIPEAIRRRPPTTDTYSLAQSQEEFYFSLPYGPMDLCLYGLNHAVPAAEVAAALGLSAEQVERVYRDIQQKRQTTRYLHLRPQLVEPVGEVGG